MNYISENISGKEAIMNRFAVENIYIIIEAVQQIEVQGLNRVCKYFDYEEK